MKRIFALLFFVAVVSDTVSAAPMTVDGYAAIVNDRVITVGDVMDYIGPAEEQLRIAYSGNELVQKRIEAFSNGVQRLVEQALIVEEFEKNGGQLPERVVNDRVNEVINDRFRSDRAAFLKALADQQTTLDEWREGIRDRMVATMLRRQEVNDRARVTPAQIRDAYEKQSSRFARKASVKLRMLVLHKGVTEADAEAKRQEAVLLRGKIIGGEKFSEVARAHSDDGKALNGGDWGWMDPDDLRPELKTAALTLKPGEVSQVLDIGTDFFLLLVEERKEAGVQPFEEVRGKIESELRSVESERLYGDWIERLKRKHHVQVFEATAS